MENEINFQKKKFSETLSYLNLTELESFKKEKNWFLPWWGQLKSVF